MPKRVQTSEIERRTRASVAYAGWVERNRHPACLICDREDDLVVHHVVDLRAVIVGVLRLHPDPDDALAHAVAMHDDDSCEGVTLCVACHDRLHAGGRPRGAPSRKALASVVAWTAAPRVLWSPFLAGSRSEGRGLRLTAFQTLLGIGWHALNGHVDPEARMVEFHKRRFAELVGKSPGTSWGRSLSRALEDLVSEDYLLGSAVCGNDVEAHLSPRYVEALSSSPWFFPLELARAPSCVALALAWHLSHQGRRRSHRIGVGKLARKVGLGSMARSRAVPSILRACGWVPFAEASERRGVFEFRLRASGTVPIHSLRESLWDSLRR